MTVDFSGREGRGAERLRDREESGIVRQVWFTYAGAAPECVDRAVPWATNHEGIGHQAADKQRCELDDINLRARHLVPSGDLDIGVL